MKLYKNRVDVTLKYIKGKVLDIGCIGMGENDTYGGKDFLHGKIKGGGFNISGLDINKRGVEKLNKLGFSIIIQDAQKPYNLNTKFDTIISEENIEHIEDLKVYLKNIHNHLKKNGRLILTTPNAMALEFMIQTFFLKHPKVNPNHTHWHSTTTIKYLLEKNGFKVEEMFIVHSLDLKGSNIFGKLMWLILRLVPTFLGRTIVVIARKR